jgi:hypothetical protein
MGASVSLSGDDEEEDGIVLAGEDAGVDLLDAMPPSFDAPAAPPTRDASDDVPWKYTGSGIENERRGREGGGGIGGIGGAKVREREDEDHFQKPRRGGDERDEEGRRSYGGKGPRPQRRRPTE